MTIFGWAAAIVAAWMAGVATGWFAVAPDGMNMPSGWYLAPAWLIALCIILWVLT